MQAAKYLGIKNVKVIDDKRLPDSMTVEWDEKVVAQHVMEYVSANREIKTVFLPGRRD